MKYFKPVVRYLLTFVLILLSINASNMPPAGKVEQYRIYTRMTEFDYVSWTINALFVKNEQAGLDAQRYLPDSSQKRIVQDYFNLVRDIDETEAAVNKIYADPGVPNPLEKASMLLKKLQGLKAYQQKLGPLAESVLQQQVDQILAEDGLTLGGQPIPPLLYHVTPLPMALIISPRNIIRQDANISLLPGLSIDQIVALEKDVEKTFNVSALVTDIGGVGTYPTMVLDTTDMNFLSDTIAHEWTHNFLTLRPLGLNYDTTPELRTMNETTASIVGGEVGTEVLKRFYPQYLPQPAAASQQNNDQPPAQTENKPPEFNFREEMHTTRVTADKLLAEGKITEAEAYMEAQRQVFWTHGYQIRRLNQAYFAFYGAYADVPGGAAGSDPVGPAVRALRQKSASLTDFLNRISWMSSFGALQKAVQP